MIPESSYRTVAAVLGWTAYLDCVLGEWLWPLQRLDQKCESENGQKQCILCSLGSLFEHGIVSPCISIQTIHTVEDSWCCDPLNTVMLTLGHKWLLLDTYGTEIFYVTPPH